MEEFRLRKENFLIEGETSLNNFFDSKINSLSVEEMVSIQKEAKKINDETEPNSQERDGRVTDLKNLITNLSIKKS
ncbi:MAG: hypothetical protein COU71_02215 [Parcubacteria group bacterium CG10_big_fil_rev_8_21_14_0_10_38_31]|nr:MAG: hypothetical protein COU71_02215 [Parcubacteria group bacterium CG10_big_fil_rev_8_21_14_0_10_38_31]